LLALWVIGRVPKENPNLDGVNRTVTDVDCPGPREKVPAPITTENGGNGAPTVPVKVLDEVDVFVMVITLSNDWPIWTFPKLREGGVTVMLIPGATLTVPTIPMEQWTVQK